MSLLERYPMMCPHVGARYIAGGTRSMLLIGESHYLPAGSRQHLTAEEWYAGDYTTLDETERGWINTSGIIRASASKGFRDKAHSIYRLAFQVINESGPKYTDYKLVAEDVVYYNYFQRPAVKGKSLQAVQQDIEIAEQRFVEIYQHYQPARVIFLSKLAFRSCRPAQSLHPPVVVTPHPGCVHWNRFSRSYGNKRGRDILAEAVTNLWSG